MAVRPNLTDALAHAAREIDSARDLQTALDTTVHAAKRSLPGIDHVGVSIAHRDGRIDTMAGTDPLVWTLDELQYEVGEGPVCMRSPLTPSWWSTTCNMNFVGRGSSRWPISTD